MLFADDRYFFHGSQQTTAHGSEATGNAVDVYFLLVQFLGGYRNNQGQIPQYAKRNYKSDGFGDFPDYKSFNRRRESRKGKFCTQRKIFSGSFLPVFSALKFRKKPNGFQILKARLAIATESRSDQKAEFR